MPPVPSELRYVMISVMLSYSGRNLAQLLSRVRVLATLLSEREAMPNAKYSVMSVEELKKEILRRQRALPRLIARREALDKLIAELQSLSDVRATPARLKRKMGKKRTRRTQGKERAGNLAEKLAEVFQGRKNGSLAQEVFLGDRNRLRAALGEFKDGPPLERTDESGGGRAEPPAEQDTLALGPAGGNGKERAALSTDTAGSRLYLAGESGQERGALGSDQAGPKAHSAEEKLKVRLLHAVTYEDVFVPHKK